MPRSTVGGPPRKAVPTKVKKRKTQEGGLKPPLRGELAEEFDGDFGYVFALVAGNF
jgi:hypothetical protein